MKTESNKSKWQKVLTWFFVLRMRSVSLNSLFRNPDHLDLFSILNQMQTNIQTLFYKRILVSLSLGYKRFCWIWIWVFDGALFSTQSLSRLDELRLESMSWVMSSARALAVSVVIRQHWHVSDLWSWIETLEKSKGKSKELSPSNLWSVLEWAEDISFEFSNKLWSELSNTLGEITREKFLQRETIWNAFENAILRPK